MVRRTQIKSLEAGTGISWKRWIDILEPYEDLSHAEMAKIALEKIRKKGVSESPEWWAQSVTVAYEQYIGRRLPGQMSDGTFTVSVSKTLPGGKDTVLKYWQEKVEGVTKFKGLKIVGEPRVSSTRLGRYWKCSLEDGSVVNVNIYPKPALRKSSLTISHEKMQKVEMVETMREFWKKFI